MPSKMWLMPVPAVVDGSDTLWQSKQFCGWKLSVGCAPAWWKVSIVEFAR